MDLYNNLSQLKDYGFRDQITRAGLSVASNIAEGLERETKADKRRLLTIATGSCAEIRTPVIIGMEIGYIKREIGQRWIQETREISAMLASLRRNLKY